MSSFFRRSLWWASSLAALGLPRPGGEIRANEEIRPPEIIVADGFEAELVAAPPLVSHPMMASFDDQGRLYVADAAGLNLPADQLLSQLPNFVRRLEDVDGDGRFDRSAMFADKMTFPQGALWHDGAVYVASPPSIWRLVDQDDDGVADTREEIVTKFGFIGNAADVHGCFLGPGGRIFWCDGRHGHEFPARGDQKPSKGLASRIFSVRADGGGVETFCGGGMDNPVELAFMPTGEPIGTMTFYNPDEARHDALVHYVYGGVYPRKHPCVSEFKRTGELMPALSRFGVTAPAGLVRYRGDRWGDDYRDNLFSAHFNTHKVMRHALARDGGTFRSSDSDFLHSPNIDFHPTDVLEDADGSLLVIDTGGWFHIGCPTSLAAKPEIKGAIYRLRRAGQTPLADPRGNRLAWNDAAPLELARRLGDPRPAVQDRAMAELVRRARSGSVDAVVSALEQAIGEAIDPVSSNARSLRLQAAWCLARIEAEASRAALRRLTRHSDAEARQAAVCALGEVRDRAALDVLLSLAPAGEIPVRREAATALGRIGDAAAVPALLEALRTAPDRFLEHALIYALIEIDDREATLPGLLDPHPDVRRGALIALDQMDRGNLSMEQVAPLLSSADPVLRKTVVDILATRPGWTKGAEDQLSTWLLATTLAPEELEIARGIVLALGHEEAVQRLLAAALNRGGDLPRDARQSLLDALAAVGPERLAPQWDPLIDRGLLEGDSAEVEAIVELVRQRRGSAPAPALLATARRKELSDLTRVRALAAAPRGGEPLSGDLFSLLDRCFQSPSAAERLAAAAAIGGCSLTTDQLQSVAGWVAGGGPLDLPLLLGAFQGRQGPWGDQLLLSLSQSPGLAAIKLEDLTSLLAGFSDAASPAVKKLLAQRQALDRDRLVRIENLMQQTEGGDPVRGEDVFFGAKAMCSACHRVGDRGARVGPELSRIGEIRSRRDLLEAIAYPSASLARGYESFQVVTTSGLVHVGLIRRETAQALSLQAADRLEIRIPQSEIESVNASAVSIMPQGLDGVLSLAELRDLAAYLSSLK